MTDNTSLKFQKFIAVLAIVLFLLKLLAWYLTKSLAIFTDAMESTVNVVTGLIGWYSLWLAAKPRDMNHPNGHGKAEFISSGIEGTLILIAGIIIIIEAVKHFIAPAKELQRLDLGMYVLGFISILNYVAGYIAIKKGRETKSLTLESGGKHLQTDTVSTIGIIVGLLLIKITHIKILDPIIALLFASFIIITGYKVMRKALAGIMDETDPEIMKEIIDTLNKNRVDTWIDIHNIRMIQYGNVLHLDGHLTLPWYFNMNQAHIAHKAINKIINDEYNGAVELFLHIDPCQEYSCEICCIKNCPERIHAYKERLLWDVTNIMADRQHNCPPTQKEAISIF